MSQSVFLPGCRTEARTRPDTAAGKADFGIGTRLGGASGRQQFAPHWPLLPHGSQRGPAPPKARDFRPLARGRRFGHSGVGAVPARQLGDEPLDRKYRSRARTWGEEMAIALSGLGRKGRRPAKMCIKFRIELERPTTAAAPGIRSSEA
jgi:hypothetical protein